MTLKEIIQAVQTRLGVEVDGNAGPETWAAIYKAVMSAPVDPAIEEAPVDSRSETHIATLHAVVKPYARALVRAALAQGIIIKVISGARTFEEQKKLYEKHLQGGPQAAPPGRSNHNYGIAFDIGVFIGHADPEKAKNYQAESGAYDLVGGLAGTIGLSWGGNWHSSPDKPHYQLRPVWAGSLSENAMIDGLALRRAQGKDPFAA